MEFWRCYWTCVLCVPLICYDAFRIISVTLWVAYFYELQQLNVFSSNFITLTVKSVSLVVLVRVARYKTLYLRRHIHDYDDERFAKMDFLRRMTDAGFNLPSQTHKPISIVFPGPNFFTLLVSLSRPFRHLLLHSSWGI